MERKTKDMPYMYVLEDQQCDERFVFRHTVISAQANYAPTIERKHIAYFWDVRQQRLMSLCYVLLKNEDKSYTKMDTLSKCLNEHEYLFSFK